MNERHFKVVSYNTLVIRFLNIFFLVSVPLLYISQPKYLSALPLVGFAGIAIVLFLLFSDRVTFILMQMVWILNIITSIGFILTFTGIVESLLSFRILALFTGFSLVSTEVYNLKLATNSPEINELRKKLGNFNFLRVFGIALGFMLSGLIAGGTFARTSALVILIISNVILIVLSFLWVESKNKLDNFAIKDLRLFNKDTLKLFHIGRYPFVTKVGIVFIILDLTIFTFWYAYIPFKLEINLDLTSELIGLMLTIQAIVHAFGQLLWQKIIMYLGNIKSFLLSISLHVLIILVITSPFEYNISILIVLFIIMGTVNSGTYLASTSLFYNGQFPNSHFLRIGVHQLCSNTGKWLGTLLVYIIIN
ncbi:hypothetical protein ACTWQB_16715 [Piscibacillus sp. B03]|uniref:hypothetical protein n=1 Tax=Piscibacillus sp. B03 TaxID=3457430 RepID=UPI003FCDECAD